MRSLQHLFNFHVQLMIWTATVALTDLFWEMLASVTQPHLQRRCEMPTTTYGAGCRFCTQICTQSATVKYAAVKLVSLMQTGTLLQMLWAPLQGRLVVTGWIMSTLKR